MNIHDSYKMLESFEQMRSCIEKTIEILKTYIPEERNNENKIACKNCGKIVIKKNPNQKYCCEDCKKKHFRKEK